MTCASFVGHVQQAQPNNGRMEVDLEGVSLQMDTFKPLGSPYAWRLAFSIHQLEASLSPSSGFDLFFLPSLHCAFQHCQSSSQKYPLSKHVLNRLPHTLHRRCTLLPHYLTLCKGVLMCLSKLSAAAELGRQALQLVP